MKLGFVSAILADYDLEQTLETAQRLGYDCVEIMCWPPGKAERRYAGVTHLDVTSLDDSTIAKVKQACSQSGISISGLGYYPNPLAPNTEESTIAVTHLQAVIRAAPKLGLNQVNTFIGRDHTKSIDDNWEIFKATWKPIIALAESCGVRVGIENCPMFFTEDEWPGGKNLAISPAIW
ncbi:MAG: sugar phosphate isomerase/epimerase family protein, partial [Planctomycetota bacterium]|nr:sugar phosphate isomerase/epimerase family protein [Planctomycetota bacterium]